MARVQALQLGGHSKSRSSHCSARGTDHWLYGELLATLLLSWAAYSSSSSAIIWCFVVLFHSSLVKGYTLLICAPRVPTIASQLGPRMKGLPCFVM